MGYTRIPTIGESLITNPVRSETEEKIIKGLGETPVKDWPTAEYKEKTSVIPGMNSEIVLSQNKPWPEHPIYPTKVKFKAEIEPVLDGFEVPLASQNVILGGNEGGVIRIIDGQVVFANNSEVSDVKRDKDVDERTLSQGQYHLIGVNPETGELVVRTLNNPPREFSELTLGNPDRRAGDNFFASIVVYAEKRGETQYLHASRIKSSERIPIPKVGISIETAPAETDYQGDRFEKPLPRAAVERPTVTNIFETAEKTPRERIKRACQGIAEKLTGSEASYELETEENGNIRKIAFNNLTFDNFEELIGRKGSTTKVWEGYPSNRGDKTFTGLEVRSRPIGSDFVRVKLDWEWRSHGTLEVEFQDIEDPRRNTRFSAEVEAWGIEGIWKVSLSEFSEETDPELIAKYLSTVDRNLTPQESGPPRVSTIRPGIN